MTLRASIVLLAVLNLGVAAWWLLRPDTVPAAVVDPPSGIARLQLLSERVHLLERHVVALQQTIVNTETRVLESFTVFK